MATSEKNSLFDFGEGPVPAHKHPNGGGWVADTAFVDDTAFVGPDARVLHHAAVRDYARLEDSACVRDVACVCGRAVVRGLAVVRESARVLEDATVFEEATLEDASEARGNALVFGCALLQQRAKVCGAAVVRGDVLLRGEAEVRDLARVHGNARLSGAAVVRGSAEVLGNARVDGAEVFGVAMLDGDVIASPGMRLGSPRDYVCIGPIGRRDAHLTVGRGKGDALLAATGCFQGALGELRDAVAKKHGDNAHGRAYQAAIDCALRILGSYGEGWEETK